jgi:hypothetical protein
MFTHDYTKDAVKGFVDIYDPTDINTWPFFPSNVGKDGFEVLDHFFTTYDTFDKLRDAIACAAEMSLTLMGNLKND